MDKVQKTQFV